MDDHFHQRKYASPGINSGAKAELCMHEVTPQVSVKLIISSFKDIYWRFCHEVRMQSFFVSLCYHYSDIT